MKQDNMSTLEHDQINTQIVNYLSGQASEEEISQLEYWIKSSTQNHDYYLQVKNVWEVYGKPFNPSDISTKEALEKVLQLTDIKVQRPGFWFYLQRVAAILFIPIMLGSFLWGRFSHISKTAVADQEVYNEVFAAYGTRSTLLLADGSKVWLNSGSSLSYPIKFKDEKRIVKLKGEAYFEVHADVSRPFIVQAQSINVIATGTKFNVQAFSGRNETQISLIKGKVLVNKQNGENNSSTIAELKPNQHLVYNTTSGKKELKDENVYRYVAWKDGKLIFRGEPLSEILKKISQIYNVEIETHGKSLQDFKYRATFQDESLDDILKLLKISAPIDYKEVKRNPLPDGSFPRKKIIIFSK